MDMSMLRSCPNRLRSDVLAGASINGAIPFRVRVYAGEDPLTGKSLYLTGSATTEREAEKIRTRLLAQVDAKTNNRTRANLSTAIDK